MSGTTLAFGVVIGFFALCALLVLAYLAYLACLTFGRRNHFGGHVSQPVNDAHMHLHYGYAPGDHGHAGFAGTDHTHENCMTEAAVQNLIDDSHHVHPAQETLIRHIVRHDGVPFSRWAAVIAGAIAFVVSFIAVYRFTSSDVSLPTTVAGVSHTMNIAFSRGFLLKAMIVTIFTSAMTVLMGYGIPGFRRGDRRDEVA